MPVKSKQAEAARHNLALARQSLPTYASSQAAKAAAWKQLHDPPEDNVAEIEEDTNAEEMEVDLAPMPHTQSPVVSAKNEAAVAENADADDQDVGLVDYDVDQLIQPKPLRRIVFVTGNHRKLDEFKQAMGKDFPIPLEAYNVDLSEFQGTSCEAIVREKCRQACRAMQPAPDEAIICDDTSLCCNALNGLPGSYVKWFANANSRTAGLYQMLHGFGGDYSAYAQCIFAFYCPSSPPRFIAALESRRREKIETGATDKSCTNCNRLSFIDVDSSILLLKGRCNGTIVSPRGSLESGWDACFQPTMADSDDDPYDGYQEPKTYAEMSADEKKECSHRTKAFEKLKRFILANYCAKR